MTKSTKMVLMNFDWANLAFGDKKAVNKLSAVFIAAPRELSAARFTALVKQYLPKGNILLGLAKEPYVEGFEGQPQFKTLQVATVQSIIDKVNSSDTKHKIYTLSYFQRELVTLLDKLKFQHVVLVNGSWKYAFHNLPAYYTLTNQHMPYDMVSPFMDETEARAYQTKTMPLIAQAFSVPQEPIAETAMMKLANQTAKFSFDYNFQTGAVLGKKTGDAYMFLTSAFNKVVPFQTYAMHHGASREKYFSPPHDLNHYDTVHAEVLTILAAQKQQLSLKDTTLFINLMPCPACARMFCESDVAEFVYSLDHSDGYAVGLLEKAGKKVRRIVLPT